VSLITADFGKALTRKYAFTLEVWVSEKHLYYTITCSIFESVMTEDTPWEDLKHSDYRALLEEAKNQIRNFDAQIEGIHRISNVILIKKSQNEYYQVKEDMPLEMSIALIEIADGLKEGLIKLERSIARLEARLDMMEDSDYKGRYK